MINLGDRLGDGGRWHVVDPFLAGNGRNFAYYVVADRAVPGRHALLKTVRKTDLPSEPLYQWRGDALRAEIRTAAKLTVPFVPEPLDAADAPDADPYVVYALLGLAEFNFLLREKIQLYGFIRRKQNQPGEGFRQIETIARYMQDVLRATNELWDAGFVHTNLNPDHLFILRDDVLRVTGLSAVCPVVNGTVAATSPGLRNLSIGYQAPEQYRAAQTAARDADAAAALEPLSADRLRWYTYAALAVDLLWGRDLREYCAENGHTYLHANDVFQKAVRKDFPRFFSKDLPRGRGKGPPTERDRVAAQRWDDMLQPREELWHLLTAILNPKGPLPDMLPTKFRSIWGALGNSDFVSLMPIDESEFAWRAARNWTRGAFFRGKNPPAADGAVGEFLVMGEEEFRPRPDGKASARYRVVNAAHPARARLGARETYLTTPPARHNYFHPGDIIAGVTRVRERPPVNGRAVSRIDVYPGDWLSPEQGRPEPEVGQRMRALSLGRRETTLENRGPVPWATIEVDGKFQTYPVRPATADHQYTVFPRAGTFFNAAFTQNARHGFGVLPVDAPPLDHLRGTQHLVAVRDADDRRVWFDLPVHRDYLVTCMLPREMCRGEVQLGSLIPVRVDRVDPFNIFTSWDAEQGESKAHAGQEYDGRVERMNNERTRVWVRFGREQFRGLLNLDHAGVVPWGVPVGSWEEGLPVRVRVRGTLPDRRNYSLELLAGERPRVEDALVPNTPYTARVTGHGLRVVQVYVEDRDGRVGVAGRIRSEHFTIAQRRNLAEAFPIGGTLTVTVEYVDPQQQLVLLVPA